MKNIQVVEHRFKMYLAMNPGESSFPGSRWKMSKKGAIDAAILARGKKIVEKACKKVLGVGPGHQSKARCERKGKHIQHWDSNMGFYWTKQEFSGYFDESPEERMDDCTIRAERREKRKRKKR